MQVKLETAKKIGFFSALSVAFGSVVGVGIFFKNIGILNQQQLSNQHGFALWSFLGVWILGAIISICAAYSFSQISTCRQSKTGLGGWIETLSNKKIGTYVKFLQPGFYYPVLLTALPTLAFEPIIQSIATSMGGNLPHIVAPFLVGFVFLALLSFFNFYTIRGSGFFQLAGTITKLIPLFLVIVVGIVGFNGSHRIVNNLSDVPIPASSKSTEQFAVVNSFNLSGLFFALPSVLFAFDNFLSVGNVAKDMHNPQRNVPIIAILTIVLASIVYVLFAIASGLTGLGTASGVLQSLTSNQDVKNGLAIFINVIITFSAIIVVNGVSIVLLRSSQGLIEDKEVMFYTLLEKLNKKRLWGGFVLYWIFYLWYSIFLSLPALILNNDAILDAGSNVPTLLFFFIYAFAMILGIRDKYTNKFCKVQIKGFVVVSIIGIVLIVFSSLYSIVWQFTGQTISDNAFFAKSGSGLFFTNGVEWFHLYDMVVIWSFLVWATLVIPTINYFVLKKYDYQKVAKQLKWTNQKPLSKW